MSRFFCGFFKYTAYPLEMVFFRPKYYYEDEASQNRTLEGPAIIVANHTTLYDFAMIQQTFIGSHIRCLMADILFKSQPLKWFLTALDGIKISREGKNFAFIEESVDILKKGGIIEIYPESRLPKEGEPTPLEFKPSAAYIAILSGAPVVPVYTDGNYFGKGNAHVMIGKKIYPEDIIDKDAEIGENIKTLTEYMRNKIIELRDETERRKEEKAKKKGKKV